MSGPESAVMNEIIYALNHYGIYVIHRQSREFPSIPLSRYRGVVWRQNVGAYRKGRSFIKYGIPGLPDFTGWLFGSGRYFSIEAKSKKGKMTPNQERHSELAAITGGYCLLARGYEDVECFFKKIGIER